MRRLAAIPTFAVLALSALAAPLLAAPAPRHLGEGGPRGDPDQPALGRGERRRRAAPEARKRRQHKGKEISREL